MSKPFANDKAWEWAVKGDVKGNLSKEHVELAYRLNQQCCHEKSNPCKRNCRLNPKCLFGLGEKKWLTNKSDDFWSDMVNPELEKRGFGEFCGLKNLGATCYVNSLLQVLYHNLHLRKAIYQWKPNEDQTETKTPEKTSSASNNASGNSLIDDIFKPQSPIGHLQLIFAKLQFSYDKNVDPEPFVRCLNLDVSLQQDAQEFCKLFLNLLEEDLSRQSNQFVKNIVQNEYRGQYNYFTKCNGCGFESQSPSSFYELSLNIGGHTDVKDCLQEFFAPEVLEGINQYHCQKCNKKENAVRTIRLTKLPPTLNLQLLRFVYDRQKGCKKKLNSFINFSETLEVNREFLSDNCDRPATYSLCAVLVHVGQSAHSGHYVAHIKDSKTGIWYKFNDERVEKIEGNSLKRSLDESNDEVIILNAAGDVEKQPPKLSKGSLSSKNAYMLVYKDSKHEINEKTTAWEQVLPEYLAASIAEEQSKFDAWAYDVNQTRNAHLDRIKERQRHIKVIFEKLQYKADSPCEWISKDWLVKWLQVETDANGEVPKIDNSSAVCPHDKLSLNSLQNMKCVNTEGASLLYGVYSGGPRLSGDLALCAECINERVNDIRLSSQLQADHKRVATLSKATLLLEEEAYWVGKESFRVWKQLASEQVDESVDEPFEEDSDPEIQVVKRQRLSLKFNDDLLCDHNKLTCQESKRKLVSYKVWAILKQYFKSATEFPKTSQSCSECQADRVKDENVKNQNRTAAQEQKQSLPELYALKRRPSAVDVPEQVTYYAVSRVFVKQWQDFIRDAAHYEAPMAVRNEPLICTAHKRLVHDLSLESESHDSKFVLLHENEWKYLSEKYHSDFEIAFHWERNQLGHKTLVSRPPFCEPCHQELAAKEREERLTYSNATIYVRKVQTKSEVEDVHETLSNGDDDNSDKPFPASRGDKKPKLSHPVAERSREKLLSCETGSSTAAAASPPRRSLRRRKYRDENEFVVSSTDTLRDLKVKIMQQFGGGIAPYDQHLSLEDVQLENNDSTLAQLNVYPNSLLLLRVDEAPANGILVEDDDEYLKGRPERGFEGTQLQKS